MSRDSKKIGGRGWVRRSAGRVAAIKRHSIADPDRQVKRLTAVIQFAGVAGYCRAEPVFSLMTSLTSSFSE